MCKLKELFFGKGSAAAFAVFSAIVTLVPEEFFKCGIVTCDWSDPTVLLINRLIVFLIVFIIVNTAYHSYRKLRKSVTIDGDTFKIKIEYKDIFKVKEGKKVIHFDECFTTTVGSKPENVKPDSVCGQYLQKYPVTEDEMQDLIRATGVKPVGASFHDKMKKYAQGILVPKGDFLLMAFAKLDRNGLAIFTYEKYLECLDRLWEQIDLYHGTDNVCIPILGSRITRFDKDLTQQELLDVIIASYRLSPKKLKKPNILHIVCKKQEGFSLNNIFGIE